MLSVLRAQILAIISLKCTFLKGPLDGSTIQWLPSPSARLFQAKRLRRGQSSAVRCTQRTCLCLSLPFPYNEYLMRMTDPFYPFNRVNEVGHLLFIRYSYTLPSKLSMYQKIRVQFISAASFRWGTHWVGKKITRTESKESMGREVGECCRSKLLGPMMISDLCRQGVGVEGEVPGLKGASPATVSVNQSAVCWL